ncbi:hypothetical protein Ddc_07207 [Ditylenchus destructor]|nr:hypothetical protein Ddc_07207 [Ditylenchus destructor]
MDQLRRMDVSPPSFKITPCKRFGAYARGDGGEIEANKASAWSKGKPTGYVSQEIVAVEGSGSAFLADIHPADCSSIHGLSTALLCGLARVATKVCVLGANEERYFMFCTQIAPSYIHPSRRIATTHRRSDSAAADHKISPADDGVSRWTDWLCLAASSASSLIIPDSHVERSEYIED